MLELAVAGDAGLRGRAGRARAAGPVLHRRHPASAAGPGARRRVRPCCSAPTPPPELRAWHRAAELPGAGPDRGVRPARDAGPRLPARSPPPSRSRRSTSRPPRSAGGSGTGGRSGTGCPTPWRSTWPGTAYIWTQNDQESDDRGLRDAVRPRAAADPADRRRDPRRGGAAQGPERGRAQGPDRALPRAAGGAHRRAQGRARRGPRGQARLRRPGRAGAAGAALPRAGDGVQEGARRRPGRAAARGLRHRARGVPPAAGHHRSRSPATSWSGTWCRTTCSSSAASCCTRAGSPRWPPARARPWSPRCRSTSTRSPGAARTWSRSTTTWPAATRSGWGTSSSTSGLTRRLPRRHRALLARAPRRLPGRHHLRHQQRVRLRLPARQHGVLAGAAGPAGARLRHHRRGGLDPHRRGADAADHLGAGGQRGGRQVRPVQPPGGRAGAEADRRGQHPARRGREAAGGREDPAGGGAQALPGPARHAEEQAAAQDAERDRASSSWSSGWSSTPSPTASCR